MKKQNTNIDTIQAENNTQKLVIAYSEGVRIAIKLNCHKEYVYKVVAQYNDGKRRFIGVKNNKIIKEVRRSMEHNSA